MNAGAVRLRVGGTGLIEAHRGGGVWAGVPGGWAGMVVAAVFALVAGWSAPAWGQITITPSASIGVGSGGLRSWWFGRVYVPAGTETLRVRTWNGRGDADLYLRPYANPGLSAWSHRSRGRTNDESVRVQNPVPGWWHVGVYGYTAYSGLLLRAELERPATPRTNISPGVLYGVSGARGSWWYGVINVPANTPRLRLVLSGGTGDADLYVRAAGDPTTGVYDFRSNGSTNEESVTIQSPRPGLLYVGVYGYGSFSGASLRTDSGAQPANVRLAITGRWERMYDGRYDLRVWIRNNSGFEVNFDDFDGVMVNGQRMRFLANLVDPLIRPGQTLETTVGFRPGFAGRRGSTPRVEFGVLVWVNGTLHSAGRFTFTGRIP